MKIAIAVLATLAIGAASRAEIHSGGAHAMSFGLQDASEVHTLAVGHARSMVDGPVAALERAVSLERTRAFGYGDAYRADECDHRDVRTLRVGASGVDLLAIASGAGDLRVEGRPGLTEVEVEAEFCASHEDLLDELDAELVEGSRRLRLDTHYPEDGDGSWWGDYYARINLVVAVPAGMPLGIDDGSGFIDVSGVGALVIHDGSGAIDAHDISGDVRIDDGSGELVLTNVTGRVEIDDGSGSLRLEDIEGDLEVDDGSGSVRIERVMGDVDIDDGSGELRVHDVGQSVTISDSSGSIVVRDVRGDFRVRRDGSGSIDHSNVTGVVDLPRRR
ncbi:MAG: hypothetical protein ABFS34_04010 [Gemmatimonadota bacterium]